MSPSCRPRFARRILASSAAARITHFTRPRTHRRREFRMSEVRSAPDLRGLENQYEIRGELRGNGTAKHYIGRTKDDRAAEVAIVIATKADGGEASDLAHYAADSQILASGGHAAVPRVLESRWVGSDSVAVISERVIGETLAELLER